ncbi:MAG: hypothetical protein ABR577_13555 [Pyrinomonadaceae bacterium]
MAKKEESGVVIARHAQVRSSTAVVAADLVEVNRGDVVDLLDTADVQDPASAENKERWYRVRAHDENNTEGWIEARNIMPEDVLERSRKLAEEDRNIQAQASGQLRAGTNLRLSPDRSGNDNIILKLETGAKFDIVGWKRVPKPKASETTESDDAPKAGSAQQNANKSKSSEAPKVPEETNELWYKVRLNSSFSPAPAGWVYGKQVELTVPSDIIFYRTGREFVAWQRLDEDAAPAGTTPSAAPKDKAEDKESSPGSWVILEKSSVSDSQKGNRPDFDRIYVLGYNKETQEHYTAYRSPDLKGFLPLQVEGRGENKTFTVRVQDADEQMRDAQYKLSRDEKGLMKVDVPTEPAKAKKKK